MSLSDLYLGSECGVDIYEEPNEDKWVECQIKAAKLGAMISVPIIIVVILIILYFGGPGVQIATIIIGCGLIAFIIALPFYIIPTSARVEHQRFQKEIGSRVANGMSRSDAIKELQRERLKREEIQAMRRNTNSGYGRFGNRGNGININF